MSTAISSVEKAQNIEVRRVKVHSPSQLPADYGTTPGGTMFGTTPGGTRIIYDRSFLLECRNSPLARSPLANLPHIPGVTCVKERTGSSSSPGKPSKLIESSAPVQHRQQDENRATVNEKKTKGGEGDDEQFEMDM